MREMLRASFASGVDGVILLSILATATMATGLGLLRDVPALIAVEQILHLRPETITPDELSKRLLTTYDGSDRLQKIRLIDHFVASNEPALINNVVQLLLLRKDPAKAGLLAVNILEPATYRYQDNRLVLLLAREYLDGKHRLQNLDLAFQLLTRPSLKDNARADYFLGILYSNENFDKFDREKSISFLKSASRKGIKSADDVLKKMAQKKI